jgi:DNA helicase-2/ATP-dependent DNA helicase PcrA
LQVLSFIFQEHNPRAKVACITYTKVAAREIKSRSPYENLEVMTIHQFLWMNIKDYKNDLKKSLIALIKKEEEKE